MRKYGGAILLICIALLAVCFLMIHHEDSSPLAGSGLTIGQQIVVSDFIPGCNSLEHFEMYTDLIKASLYDGKDDRDCTVLDKGTHLKLVDAETVSTKTTENITVTESTILSGPKQGQAFWSTVENLASVTPGAHY